MEPDEIRELASRMIATGHRLLEVYDLELDLWAGDAKLEQRCPLCGTWIHEGDKIRTVVNRKRSDDNGYLVGDYAHRECPIT